MSESLKIGELAKLSGVTTKTIRYYELLGLLEKPGRTESGYRLFSQEDVERLVFIQKAKHLGLSLEDICGILALHKQSQVPCIHVLALLDQKVKQVDILIRELTEFREELVHVRQESQARLEQVPEAARICPIIEQGVHAKGEMALVWLNERAKH